MNRLRGTIATITSTYVALVLKQILCILKLRSWRSLSYQCGTYTVPCTEGESISSQQQASTISRGESITSGCIIYKINLIANLYHSGKTGRVSNTQMSAARIFDKWMLRVAELCAGGIRRSIYGNNIRFVCLT